MSLIETITEQYEKEQLPGYTPARLTARSQVPHNYEELNVEWLTDVLCSDVPGAEVTTFELGAVDDGSSNRRRIAVTYNDAGREADLPAFVFCKASFELKNRILLGVTGCTHAESTFFAHVRDTIDIEAPKGFVATWDPISYRSILVMADLGDDSAPCDFDTSIDLERAKEQLSLLAGLHGPYYDHDGLGDAPLDFITWPEWFDNLLSIGFEHGHHAGFAAAVDVVPAALHSRGDDVWAAVVKSVQRHDGLPHTLIHGDTHLKNWYTKGGHMGLLDWQAMCRGSWSRDVAYAISSALKVEDRRAWEDELLRHYLSELAANGGPEVSFEAAHQLYRQQLFGALAFWTITLMPSEDMPDMQPPEASLAFIGRIATAIDDLKALDAFDA